jgi:2-phosphoglycerate kinase
MTTPNLQALFSRAYILGGSPCSGKSTIAEMLSTQYSFHYYKADDHDPEHLRSAQPDRQPTMFKYSKMSWDEIWSQSVEQLLADEITYYYERFPFILDDLNRLETEKSVILEGAAFLPELIQLFVMNSKNVIFMVPTREFQIQYYSQRPWAQSILNTCRDPKGAFENWMNRDVRFGEEIARQANHYHFQTIIVDGSVNIQNQFEHIRTLFNLGK